MAEAGQEAAASGTGRSWRPPGRAAALAELGLLIAWALVLGRAYLDFDPLVWPRGHDFPLTLQPHYAWLELPRCGLCVLWNGGINGGYPAFVETHSAILHPLVVLPTLAFGVLAGAKIGLLASLALAGIAQWWLGWEMRLGRTARLWVGALAVAGGHMAGKMELGLSAMLLSTASAGLAIAAAVRLARTHRRRDAILFAALLALAVVSGQGYIQLGLALAVIPALLVFVLDRSLRPTPLWKEFALGLGLSALLSGLFLVPLLHFWANLGKHAATAYAGGQPLEYIVLNWVIRDPTFWRTETLGRVALPALYLTYIGWVPVLLAVYALIAAGRAGRRLALFFVVSIALVLVVGSGNLLRWMAESFPAAAAAYRYPALVTTLAVPLVLGLAGWGLDALLRLPWPRLSLSSAGGLTVSLSAAVIVVGLPLAASLRSVYGFSRPYLTTFSALPDLAAAAEATETERTQWLSPPTGHAWVPPMLEAGRRVTEIYRPWFWRDRQPPAAHLVARLNLPEDQILGELVGRVYSVTVYRLPQNEYAAVETAAGRTVCDAAARGGYIEVECPASAAGRLVVYENAWSGWRAWRDGARVRLLGGQWLSVEAPAGAHSYRFRYLPWDVGLGALATLAGLALAAVLWRRSASDGGGNEELLPGEPPQGEA